MAQLFSVAADFIPLVESVTFHGSGRQCVTVTITVDSVLENLEKFTVVATTRDDRIEFKRYYVTVYIIEDSGQFYLYEPII